MKQYTITGMSCAACSARIEKAVSAVNGVKSCSVNLLTNSMAVDGDVSAEKIISAVENAGYGAEEKGKSFSKTSDAFADRRTPLLKRRFIYSLIFLIVLMYFSMGHMMLGLPLPSYFNDNHIAVGLVQLLLTAAVMIINQDFFINGFKGLIHRSPNMDTLVSLGSAAAFIYSTYALFAMTSAQTIGDTEAVMTYMNEFYFESSAMILTLITVGKMLESYSKGKTTDALKGLIDMSPDTAVVLYDGNEVTVPVQQIKKGDIFIVKTGEKIAADGIVIDGNAAVDESALTGESIPADKSEGDTVSAASVNISGFLKCEAVRVGEDTTLSQIIKMVTDASADKAPIARTADKVSAVFVPAVMTIAALTTIIWLISGSGTGFALARGISVLVISCPCALGLATPVAIMAGSGVGAKNAILFKNAASLENAGRIKNVVLDKTGTVTMGKPSVTNIIPSDNISDRQLMDYAVSLEKKSQHPLAAAIINEGEKLNIPYREISDFKVFTGNGLSGKLDNSEIYGGNLAYISSKVSVSEEMRQTAENLSKEGKTPLFFAKDNSLIGIIAVADVIKPESPETIRHLKNMGMRVVMLTGDNKLTADAIGKQVGIDEIIAGVLPNEKGNIVQNLKKSGITAMVGDGINDAPALTCADIGIAIGAGTDIAIDAADIVLMNSRLSDVPALIRLGRNTLHNIHENLFWAFIYNVVGIPLAAGLFIPLLGWKLNPIFAAAAMSLSSFCVVSNSLRLNLADIHSPHRDHSFRNKFKLFAKEMKVMQKTIYIDGMMCPHCEATVKKILENLPQVESAETSHKDGTAIITLNADISEDILKKAIEDNGYTFVK